MTQPTARQIEAAIKTLKNMADDDVRFALDDHGMARLAPGQQAAGRVSVAPGQTISSGWGNAVWDQSVQCFASVADRNNQYPAPHEGAVCFTDAEHTFWVYVSGAWKPTTAQTPWGQTALWGAYDAGRPVRQLASYWESTTSAAAGVELDAPTGKPWTSLLGVLATGRFQYNVPGWLNVVPMINRESCLGTSTGGHLSFTCINLAGNGAGATSAYAGFSYVAYYQD